MRFPLRASTAWWATLLLAGLSAAPLLPAFASLPLPSFTNHSLPLPTLPEPLGVALGDLNGDGRLDLVVVSATNRAVSVRLALQSGMFGSAVDYFPAVTTGPGPTSAIVADINGDGHNDVVVAMSTVAILWGTASGSLSGELDLLPGYGASSLGAADFDRDGMLDLVVLNETKGEMTLFLYWNGAGYDIQTSYAIGLRPTDLAVGDLNGDGRPDIVTANNGDGHVAVLLNVPRGFGFYPAVLYLAGNGPRGVALADLNADGVLDLATTNEFGNTISVFFNTGSGTFGSQQVVATGPSPKGITTCDFNRDGRPDLVTANSGEHAPLVGTTVSVIPTIGPGTFGSRVDFAVGVQPRSVVATDIDGDGNIDLLCANRKSNSVTMLLGDGQGGAGTARDMAVDEEPIGAVAADFNHDGFADLVTACLLGNDLNVLLGDGTGQFSRMPAIPTGPYPYSLAVTDLDMDGKLDIATTVGTETTFIIQVVFGNGDGTFSPALTIPANGGPVSVAAGDLNKDGIPDLVSITEGVYDPQCDCFVGGDSLVVVLGLGARLFAAATTYAASVKPTAVTICDLNGDGNLDVITSGWAPSIYDPGTISVLLGDGTGHLAPKTEWATGVYPRQLVAQDMNQDGHLDIVAACAGPYESSCGCYLASNVAITRGDGNGGLQAPQNYPTGYSPLALAVDDFNGDGLPDVATSNFYANTATVLLGQIGGALGDRVDFGVGSFPWGVAASDFDGDGLPDLAVVNRSYIFPYSLTILRNLGGSATSVPGGGGVRDAGAPGGLIVHTRTTTGPVFEASLATSDAVDLSVFTAAGTLVGQWSVPASPRKDTRIRWAGTDRGARPVPSGMYIVSLHTAVGAWHSKFVLIR